jgi:branched-chain amino acid transport system permease protein
MAVHQRVRARRLSRSLGGALQIPRDAVHHALDLRIIVDVFVVVVIGGLGSIIGAFVAAVLVSELNAFGILIFRKSPSSWCSW